MTNAVVARSLSGIRRKNSLDLSNVVIENLISGRTLKLVQREERSLASSDDQASEETNTESRKSSSSRPVSEHDRAAVVLQKVYKSYRIRRTLADCAVVVEELWWKELDSSSTKRCSVSLSKNKKSETALSRWVRAGTRAAKVGKGLLKDEKAQKLALRHWLEAIDPRHRYGHNLHLYYDVWFRSESHQPFFYWLDVGDGKDVTVEKCSRAALHSQCIEYLEPRERMAYEVIVQSGKLIYKKTGKAVDTHTPKGSKWIFVLSTTRELYVGEKKKGKFHHSSFVAGAAITAAGRIVATEGKLEAIWPHSGHYHPTEENFNEFVFFLEENDMDLIDVKRFCVDEDSSLTGEERRKTKVRETPSLVEERSGRRAVKWTTGAGPRIGWVRDYPTQLQSRAMEKVNLSPRRKVGSSLDDGPLPSPRPIPKLRVSPRLANI